MADDILAKYGISKEGDKKKIPTWDEFLGDTRGDPLTPDEQNAAREFYKSTYAEEFARQRAGKEPSRNKDEWRERFQAEQDAFNKAVDEYAPRQKVDTALDTAGNYGRAFLSGALGAARGTLNVFGGGETSAARSLGETVEGLQKAQTPTERILAQRNQQEAQRAEETGVNNSIWDDVKRIRGTDVASGAGSLAVSAAGGLAGLGARAGLLAAGATRAATLAPKATAATLGSAMGVGGLRTNRYDAVKQDALDQGNSPEVAERMAVDAMELTPGETLGAGVMGAADSLIASSPFIKNTSIRAGTSRFAKTKDVGGGVIKESGQEAGQTGYEEYLTNEAKIKYGLQEPGTEMRGVRSKAVQAGAIGGLLGGGTGTYQAATNKDVYVGDIAKTIDETKALAPARIKQISKIVDKYAKGEGLDKLADMDGAGGDVGLAAKIAAQITKRPAPVAEEEGDYTPSQEEQDLINRATALEAEDDTTNIQTTDTVDNRATGDEADGAKPARFGTYIPSETGSQPGTEAPTRLAQMLDQETGAGPITIEAATSLATEHEQGYSQWAEQDQAPDAVRREPKGFIEGTVDNILATAYLQGMEMDPAAEARGKKRAEQFEAERAELEKSTRYQLGDRTKEDGTLATETEFQQQSDKKNLVPVRKKEAAQSQVTQPATSGVPEEGAGDSQPPQAAPPAEDGTAALDSMVGGVVEYGGYTGTLTKTQNGYYVAGQLVESGESGQTPAQLGVTPVSGARNQAVQAGEAMTAQAKAAPTTPPPAPTDLDQQAETLVAEMEDLFGVEMANAMINAALKQLGGGKNFQQQIEAIRNEYTRQLETATTPSSQQTGGTDRTGGAGQGQAVAGENEQDAFGQPAEEFAGRRAEDSDYVTQLVEDLDLSEQQLAEIKGVNLFSNLGGMKLTREDWNEISGKYKKRKGGSKAGQWPTFAMGGENAVSLSDRVADGDFDAYLPYDMQTTSTRFDEQESTEFIKEALSSWEPGAVYYPVDVRTAIQQAENAVESLEKALREEYEIDEINREIQRISAELAQEAGAINAEQTSPTGDAVEGEGTDAQAEVTPVAEPAPEAKAPAPEKKLPTAPAVLKQIEKREAEAKAKEDAKNDTGKTASSESDGNVKSEGGNTAKLRGTDAARQELAAGIGAKAGQPAQADDQGREGLTAPTPDEIRAKETAKEKAEADKAKKDREDEQRAKADAERGDFKLTGSDRAADVAAANGQQDLLAEPAEDVERFERRMRAAATDNQTASDDVQTTGLRWVPFGIAKKIASEAIASGVPANWVQLHTRTDLTADSARRILDGLAEQEGLKFSQGTTPKTGNTTAKVNATLKEEGLDRNNIKVVQSWTPEMVQGVEDGRYSQIVYHGTPYRGIDKFSTGKIGTGEGAQAYGWGLYFADKRSVGEWYREKLSNPYQYLVNDQPAANDAQRMAAQMIDLWRGNKARIEVELKADRSLRKAKREQVLSEVDSLIESGANVRKNTGQLYEVTIPDDTEMLLWDKPLSEQPEGVRKALEGAGVSTQKKGAKFSIIKDGDGFRIRTEKTGNLLSKEFDTQQDAEKFLKDELKFLTEDPARNTYERLSQELGGDKAASQYLNSLGIKGIKFLDGTSRSAGEGSFNYVIFDGADTEINRTFYSKDGEGVQGFYNPANGEVTLVADNIPEGKEAGVALHEVFHRAEEAALTDQQRTELTQQVKRWALRDKKTNERKIFDAANKRAKESGDEAGEFLAYAIEEARNMGIQPNAKKGTISAEGWLAKVQKYFTAALEKLVPGYKGELSADDLVDIAYGIAARDAEIQQASGRIPAFDDVRKPKENISAVRSALSNSTKLIGNRDVPMSEIAGAMSLSADDAKRARDLAEQLKKPGSFFERIIVDDAGNVIEGQHRVAALRILGANTVPAVVIKDNMRDFNAVAVSNSMKAAQPMRSDALNSLVSSLSEIYADEGGNMAEVRKYDAPKGYQKAWDAGLSALDAEIQQGVEQTETAAFKNWFAGSKVVDTEAAKSQADAIARAAEKVEFDKSRLAKLADGHPLRRVIGKSLEKHQTELQEAKVSAKHDRPLVVYHGGGPNITAFRRSPGGRAIWASDAPVANTYAGSNEGATVYPIYLRAENPLAIDAEGRTWQELSFEGERVSTDDLADIAEERGYDGLIIRNLRDENSDDGGDTPATHYAVFDPVQVKSATGNQGTFDPTNPDIRYSRQPLNIKQMEEMAKTGKMPDTDPMTLQKAEDLAATTFVDSTRPHDVWARSQDPELAADLVRRKNLAPGRIAAFEKKMMDLHGRDIANGIGAIAKRNGMTFEAAKQLAGNWMSARYAPIANQYLKQKDQKELTDAISAATADPTPANKAAVTRARNQMVKRSKAIAGPATDPTQARLDAGVAGGYTDAMAKKLQGIIEQAIPKKDLEALADMVYDLNEWKLDQDLQSGRVTPQMVAQWPQSRLYVPLTGDPRSDQSEGADMFATGSVNQSKDKAIGGRTSSLAQNGIDASFEQVDKAAKYHGWEPYKESLHNWYEKAKADLVAGGATEQEAAKQIADQYGITRAPETMQRPSDNTIIYRKAGESWVYDLGNQEAVAALKSSYAEPLSTLAKGVAIPTRFLARSVTMFLPGFGPLNMIRDIWEKSENIRSRGEKLGVDMNKVGRDMLALAANPKTLATTARVSAEGGPLEGILKLDPKDPDQKDLKEFLELGGGATWGDFVSGDSEGLSKKLEGALTLANSKGGWGLTKTVAGNTVKAMETWNNAFELKATFASYQAMIRNGIPKETAAEMALELMNFRKGGKVMKPFKAAYMFAQPIATGGQQMYKTLKTPRGQKRFSAMLGIGMGLYALLRSGYEDEETGENLLDNESDWLLERNILVKLPGMQEAVKIPVGFGTPQLAWGTAINLDRFIWGRQTAGETVANLAKLWAKTIAPVAPSEASIGKDFATWLTQTVTPTIAKPIVNVGLNKNSFGGTLNPSDGTGDKADALKGKRTTPQEYKDFARFASSELGVDTTPEAWRELSNYLAGPIKEFLIKPLIEGPNRKEINETLAAAGKETAPVVGTMMDRFVYGYSSDNIKQRLYYRYRDEMVDISKKASLDKPLSPRERQMLNLYKEVKSAEGRARSILAQATKSKSESQMERAKIEHAKAMIKIERDTLKRMNSMRGLD